jgi:hypothetical protein
MNQVKKIITSVYVAGIGVSSLIGIRELNIETDTKNKQLRKVDYSDYAMQSAFGFMVGTYTGLFWPITVVGRLSVKLFPPSDD